MKQCGAMPRLLSIPVIRSTPITAARSAPDRARFTDFDPFWEFVAGPINAGTSGPTKWI
jgi:hypothetical protein